MDREILSHCRDYRIRLAAVSAIGLCLTISGRAFSQERPRFQMPTAQDMFRQNDKNGDGRLDSNEINSNPFLPRMLERSGLDTSRGISERDFSDAMDDARRNFERNGGTRQFGGGDRGSGGDRGGGREQGGRRGGEEGDDEDRQDRQRGNRSRDQRSGGQDGNQDGENDEEDRRTTDRKSRPRVTIDLQEDLLPGDSDGDGQLAFYEWRRWEGKSLSEFNALDTNGDGYVTPREVALLRGPTPDEIAATAAAADARTDDRDSRTRRSDGSRDGNAEQEDEDQRGDRDDRRRADDDSDGDQERESDGEEDDGQLAADAERYFGLMDKDRDGSIAPDEWEGRRIRSMFEDDGIDLDSPVSQQEFIRNYVRLSAGGG